MSYRETEAWAIKFWRLAGHIEPFPRSLERSMSWALPLILVKLNGLSVLQVRRWLAEKRLRTVCSSQNRPLEACLVAARGHGIVFLDDRDAPDRQRFALAHEIAHFLVDYLGPRRRAIETLGESVREVLDGHRAATIGERVSGVLRGVPLDSFTHLMERSSSGAVRSLKVLTAEDRADSLALELLAPRDTVLARLRAVGIRWQDAAAASTVEETLVHEFGLPVGAARSYSHMLAMAHRTPRSFREWFKSQRVEVRGFDRKN